jgi:hypothetical protein
MRIFSNKYIILLLSSFFGASETYSNGLMLNNNPPPPNPPPPPGLPIDGWIYVIGFLGLLYAFYTISKNIKKAPK